MKLKIRNMTKDKKDNILRRLVSVKKDCDHDTIILQTEDNKALGDEVERKFKEVEEYIKQCGSKVNHNVPFFITNDGTQPRGDCVKPGDEAVFSGSLHTVDEEGFLVDNDTGLLAGPGGFCWDREDTKNNQAQVYMFIGHVVKAHK